MTPIGTAQRRAQEIGLLHAFKKLCREGADGVHDNFR